MAGLTDPQIRCVVAYYPLTDIAALGDLYGPGSPETELIGGHSSHRPELARDASPINHVTAASPPCLLVHGDADKLLPASQSESMHARLTAAGAQSTYRPVPGADHCFDGYVGVSGLIAEAVDYLRAHLG